jgi:hypothetical protein
VAFGLVRGLHLSCATCKEATPLLVHDMPILTSPLSIIIININIIIIVVVVVVIIIVISYLSSYSLVHLFLPPNHPPAPLPLFHSYFYLRFLCNARLMTDAGPAKAQPRPVQRLRIICPRPFPSSTPHWEIQFKLIFPPNDIASFLHSS